MALITGANRGIGYAAVEGLARTGMTVFLGARDADAARERAASLRAQGLDVRDVQLDVTDPGSIERAAASVQRSAGRLDVLVNNAGTPGEPSLQTAGTAELDAVRAVFETNVFGVVAVTEAMLPLLRRSERARIINLSSSIGSLALMSDPDHYFSGLPGWLGYPPSKAALNQITVQYAKQLREEGILVNAADPGPTATALGRSGRADVTRTPAEGARIVIELATTASTETGGYRRDSGPVPW
ncbi:SDR family NAD(P)-dependent oxidoreductase [Microlunatus soli]|uniref:SDR family NAD(P)-dependent oxidoreductase n=1 Tax=Microlunatus soli TaxID=630515 RepID=UPI001E50A70E|nr:SDR family NAD(P)-dependent oxidoreductase [Microlunatus soli]